MNILAILHQKLADKRPFGIGGRRKLAVSGKDRIQESHLFSANGSDRMLIVALQIVGVVLNAGHHLSSLLTLNGSACHEFRSINGLLEIRALGIGSTAEKI